MPAPKIIRKLGMERFNPTVSGEAKATAIAGVSIASLLLTAVSLVSTVNTYFGAGKRAKALKAESGEYVAKYASSLRGNQGVMGQVRSKTHAIAEEEDETGTVGIGADGKPVKVSGSGQGPLYRVKEKEGNKLDEEVDRLTLATQGRIQNEYEKAASQLATETSVVNATRDSEAAIEARMDAAMGSFVRRVNVEIMGEFERALQALIDSYVVAVNAAEAKYYPEGNKRRTDSFTIDVERKVKAPDSNKLFGLPTTPFWETVGKSFELFGPWAFALIMACVYLGYLGEGGLEMEMIPNHRKRLRIWLAKKFNRPEWAMDDPDASVKLGEGLSHEHAVVVGKTQDFVASMQRWVNALTDQVTMRLDNSIQWGELNGIKQEELAGVIAGILDRASQYPSLFDQMFATWVHGEVVQSAMVMGKEVRQMQADPRKLVRMLEAGSALDCTLSILAEAAGDQSVYTSAAIQIAIGIGRRIDLGVGEKEKLFRKLIANCRRPDVLKGMAHDYVTPSEGEVVALVSGGLLTRDPDGLYHAHARRPVIIQDDKRYRKAKPANMRSNRRDSEPDEIDEDNDDGSPDESPRTTSSRKDVPSEKVQLEEWLAKDINYLAGIKPNNLSGVDLDELEQVMAKVRREYNTAQRQGDTQKIDDIRDQWAHGRNLGDEATSKEIFNDLRGHDAALRRAIQQARKDDGGDEQVGQANHRAGDRPVAPSRPPDDSNREASITRLREDLEQLRTDANQWLKDNTQHPNAANVQGFLQGIEARMRALDKPEGINIGMWNKALGDLRQELADWTDEQQASEPQPAPETNPAQESQASDPKELARLQSDAEALLEFIGKWIDKPEEMQAWVKTKIQAPLVSGDTSTAKNKMAELIDGLKKRLRLDFRAFQKGDSDFGQRKGTQESEPETVDAQSVISQLTSLADEFREDDDKQRKWKRLLSSAASSVDKVAQEGRIATNAPTYQQAMELIAKAKQALAAREQAGSGKT